MRALLLFLSCLLPTPVVAAAHLPVSGSAWRLALADLDRDGSAELIYGTYQGAVAAMRTSDNRALWRRDLGAFPFAIASDGGRVYAAAAGGMLYALRPSDGTVAWTWRSAHQQALHAATPVNQGGRRWIATGGMDRTVTVLVAGTGKPVASYPVEQLVGRMAAADFDGDGDDELLVIDRRNEAELLRFNGTSITRVWRRRMQVPDAMKNWENPNGNFNVFSLELADVDGDGRPEIIAGDSYFNRQSVMVASGDGKARWIAPPLEMHVSRDRWYELYATAWVKVAEVDANSAGKEIVSVTGGLLRIFSAAGKVLVSAEAPIGFADLAIDGKTLYLGSSPNGDATIYRLPLDTTLATSFRDLQWTSGLARRVQDNLNSIAAAVAKRKSLDPATARRQYDVQMAGGVRSERTIAAFKRYQAWFRQQFPYSSLRLVASAKLIEPTPPLNPEGKPWNPSRWRTDSINGTMTVDQIVDLATLVEKHQIPTIFNIGHSCMPFITLKTAERVLQAAPNYTVGFLSAEDENPLEVPGFSRHFLQPLSELCTRAGGGDKLAITKNKGLWWMSMPARPEVFDPLFAEGRHKTMQGRTEDSNSRSPEINLMARFGLRQAGLLPSMHASTIGDLYSFNRFWQWEYPKQGHAWLRLLIAHALLGANSFEYRTPGLITVDGRPPEMPRIAAESMGLFLHLLGKGLIFTPAPDQQVGMSRIGIAVHPPPDKWVADAHNGHRPESWTFDPELENAVLPRNGSLWGLTPTPQHSLSRVLFHKERQFGYHVPPTPYGAVAIVPARAGLDKVAGVTEWWHTDGISLWKEGGRKLTGTVAAAALEQSFRSAAASLPFRASGDDVFFHSVRVSPGRYRLVAIDPGWLDPAERNIEIHKQLSGAFRYRDLITGQTLRASPAGRLTVTVPAGAFRILEAETADETLPGAQRRD